MIHKSLEASTPEAFYPNKISMITGFFEKRYIYEINCHKWKSKIKYKKPLWWYILEDRKINKKIREGK
jgi:hypothetical protein